MEQLINNVLEQLQASPEVMTLSVLAVGVMIMVYGVSQAFAGPTAEVRRLGAGSARHSASADYDLVRGDDNDTFGLLRAFVPTSEKDRTRIRSMLRKAGVQRRNAVVLYYLTRSALGFGMPLAYIAALQLPPDIQSQYGLTDYLSGQSFATMFYVVTVLALVGFYLPSFWLKRKIAARKQRIWEAMPNALDLLQVSAEAGLSFDAAIVRVSHELSGVAPDIAAEFMMLELEIQAGKDKQKAFLDMADRTSVEEMAAFANVILQAGQYGTSISNALTTYADEMRLSRELRAQEKANRLPVQMSGVMAVMMMPALLIICLAPMLIRWVRMFG
ncbi:MAG: type II secretion system F family protein [Boseongicola sp.]|nr:type II secretion system F family protein [Boseongicola sp.]